MTKLLAALAATLILAGCGTYDDDPYSDNPADTSGYDLDGTFNDEISDIALQIAWDGMTPAEQSDICFGWSLNRDYMLDSFMAGADGSISRSDAAAFIDTVC